MNRKDLQQLSLVRLKEAKALLAAGCADGAFYLAGYSIECALKACIAKKTMRHDFPDKKRVDSSHTHSLKELVRVAELETALRTHGKSDPHFEEHWDTLQLWSEQSRYNRSGLKDAHDIIEAVGDRKHGVLSWLKLHW